MSAVRPRLVLASSSPRRRDLLSRAGFAFEVVVPQVDEIQTETLTLREATCWNALRKGLVIARQRPNEVVLAADTLVALEHRVIGKPSDRKDAARILRLLSGQTHYVCSSVFIAFLAAGKSQSFSVTSRVVFKKLSEEMIEDYLSRIDPLDKAGAYAAQGHGAEIIERVEGSFSNVVGLPMEKTSRALRAFGITQPP